MTLQRSNGNDDGDDDSSEIIDSGVARWKPHLFFAKGSCRGSSWSRPKYIIDGHEGAKPRRYGEWLFYCCCSIVVVVVRIVLFPTTKKMSIATKSIDSGVALSNGFLRRVNSEHESAQPRKPSE